MLDRDDGVFLVMLVTNPDVSTIGIGLSLTGTSENSGARWRMLLVHSCRYVLNIFLTLRILFEAWIHESSKGA
jgi:hypothetical protein